MSASRNRNGASWTSRLPSRLKLLFHLPHDEPPERPFRMTHVPDRPARNPAQAAPTDEKCLQYLLAVQYQEINSAGRPCSSVYSQEGGSSPFLNGIGARRKDLARRRGFHDALSPKITGERFPGWDAVVSRSMSPSSTVDSADPRGSWSLPLWRPSDLNSETTIRSSGSVTLQAQHISQYNDTKDSLTPGTCHAQDPLCTDDGARDQGARDLANTSSRQSLPPEARVSDGDDDVYAGWAEYYFDEKNFRGRDGVGRYIGKMTGHVRLPAIGEFF